MTPTEQFTQQMQQNAQCSQVHKQHMSGHKTTNKFKNIEIIPSIFSCHNRVKLEVRNRRKTGKLTNTRKFKTTLPNNQRVKEEIKEEIRNYLETNET